MKKYAIELKWGVIFIGTMLVWMLLERLAGLHSTHVDQHYIYTNLFAVVAISVYVFALLDKKKNYFQGVMSWKQGFLAGLVVTLVVVVLSPVGQFITHQLISPNFFPNLIEHSVNAGQMSRAEAEAFFNLNSYMMQSAVGALVMGLLTSAVVAFFTKGGAKPQVPTA